MKNNKKYLKIEENNNSIENINLINLILKNLPENQIKDKLMNHEKFLLKVKNLSKYKDFTKIHISNWKYYLKCYIFQNGINFLSQKSFSIFIILDELIIKEINKIISEVIKINQNNKKIKIKKDSSSENSNSIKKNDDEIILCNNCKKNINNSNDLEFE